MRSHRLIPILLAALLSAEGARSTTSIAFAGDPAAAQDSIPWDLRESAAMLDVGGDSLEVVLTSPDGQRDTWRDGRRASQIPRSHRFTGASRSPQGDGRIPPLIYRTGMLIDQQRGDYTLQVTSSRILCLVGVRAGHQFVADCDSRDSTTLRPGESAVWKVSWSTAADSDTCWVRLSRQPEPRGNATPRGKR